MDELKNDRNVVNQGEAILNTLQYLLLKFLDVHKRKKQGDSGPEDDWDRNIGPCLPVCHSVQAVSR
jgi:hypothetical protein